MEMETKPSQVRDFTELESWQVARKLRQETYKVTQNFPAEEKYGLVAPLRRTASSITANVAEGFGRFSYQENIRFLRQSRGSAFELRNHLTTSLDAKYVSREKFFELDEWAKSVIRLLNGYIRSTRERQKAENAK